MIRFNRGQVLPIGLDIGYDSIKMLQLSATGDALSVVAAARQVLPEEVRNNPELRLPAAVDLIRQMLRRHPFRGRRIVAALPRHILHVKNLRLPVMPLDELAAAVDFEARNIFPFDTEQAHVRFLPAGEIRQGTDVRQEVVVLAARHGDVDNFLEHMHCCGVTVESLDFEPCAIYRGIERFVRRKQDENEVHVLLDIGLRRSQVVIGKGREICFFKPIDIGGQRLHEAVARKLGITPDEALALRRRLVERNDAGDNRDAVRQAVFDATRSELEQLGREVSLCLRYYSVTFRGHRPSRVRLVGGEAADPQLRSILNSVLTIPLEAGSPLYSVDHSRMKPTDRSANLCAWALAFGLSLKTTTGYFGARDGRRRDPFEPTDDPHPSIAEVIDISSAVEDAAAPVSAAASPAAATGSAAKRPSAAEPAEVVHA
jgi:type IV pilus assembly protein PilM